MGYFWELMKIDFKRNLEYKINLYSHFGLVFTDLFITLFSLIVLKNNFGFFVLSYNEIIYFTLHIYFIWMFIGSSVFSKNLEFYLLKGEINQFLNRPMNVFKQYFLITTRSRRLMSSFVIFLLALIYVFYYEISFVKFIITLLFSLLGAVSYLAITCFLDSFSFFMKKGNFLYKLYDDADHIVHNFPYSFLENSQYSKLWLLFPSLFFGSVVTEYLFDYRSFLEVLNLSYYVLGFLLISMIGTFLLWKAGLKRYEGFN